jgi:hypothetical protein
MVFDLDGSAQHSGHEIKFRKRNTEIWVYSWSQKSQGFFSEKLPRRYPNCSGIVEWLMLSGIEDVKFKVPSQAIRDRGPLHPGGTAPLALADPH